MICPLAPSSSRGFGQQIGPVRGVNPGHISVNLGYSRPGLPELPFASIFLFFRAFPCTSKIFCSSESIHVLAMLLCLLTNETCLHLNHTLLMFKSSILVLIL